MTPEEVARERAATIRARLMADMTATLSASALSRYFDSEQEKDLVEALTDDALHHIALLLAEIQARNEDDILIGREQ